VKYLLDANAVIALLRGHEQVRRRIVDHRPEDFGLPSVVVHELYFGAFRSVRTEHHLSLLDALRFEVVAFDRDDARAAARVRADLATAGTPIGPYDVLIAAQAMARDLTLITHNSGEFRRVAGLLLEDWEAA
jgi:tRNA(fMet)-specific endonuclease VapC